MSIKSKNLRASKLLDGDVRSDDDPMASMGNLMDVMLVFACGLIIALMAHYDVDITASPTDLEGAEPLEAEISEQGVDVSGSGSTYVELGTVYRDAETGELYVVTDEDDGGAEPVDEAA